MSPVPQSKALTHGTCVFVRSFAGGAYIAEISNRLASGEGWRLVDGGKVYDDGYGAQWVTLVDAFPADGES